MRRLFPLLFLLAQVCVAAPLTVRVATFNSSLHRDTDGQLANDLATPTNLNARKVAEILQRVRPDIVLLNEFDYDAGGLSRDRFHDNYLAVSQNGQPPLSYPYRFAPPSNTGIPSGFDYDNNGTVNDTTGTTTTSRDLYGADCYGFGWFPGQYGFVVYSRFPIRTADIRTFQSFLWKDMPGAVLPDKAGTPPPQDWYSAAELATFRLSSKNHADVPIEVAPGQLIHLLASHPTPPSFDGPEDRNGHRNHDEIRFWADYVNGADYLYDDTGARGGLASGQRFIILGDMNADPLDGDSYLGAINQLLQHSRIDSSFIPSSPGGTQQAQLQGGANIGQLGDPAYDTGDFSDAPGQSGNLRIDHLLPSRAGLRSIDGAVFWPLKTDPTFSLTTASDHHLVWFDIGVAPIIADAVRGLAVGKENADTVLTFLAQQGLSYSVQTSPDLSTWSDAPAMPVTVDPSLHARAVDTASASGTRFYRIAASLNTAGSLNTQALSTPAPPPKPKQNRARTLRR